MHGHIHACLRDLVLEKFGDETWQNILKAANCDENTDFMVFHAYSDEKTMNLVMCTTKEIGLDLNTVLEVYGNYFYTYVNSKGYGSLIRTLGENFMVFVNNLDNLHSLLAMTYKGMDPPSFRWTQVGGKNILELFSTRKGLWPVAVGMLKECAKRVFNVEAEMKVIEIKHENIEKLKFREQAIFEVTLDASAQAELDEIYRLANEEKQLNTDHMDNRDNIQMDPGSFLRAMPYTTIFDKNMMIRSRGLSMKTLCPATFKKGACFNTLFKLVMPLLPLTYDIAFEHRDCMVLTSYSERPPEKDIEVELMYFKGHFVSLEAEGQLAFVCQPHFGSMTELINSKRYLSTIPIDDLTREILFLNEQRKGDIEMSKRLDETTVALRQMKTALETEKKKTDTLLFEMLPEKVANQLRDGQTVDAEKFEISTILFSDIVTFTNMASACEPIQVVHVLNDMFQRFDRQSSINDVYKVETIGDAYMVVGGVPERTPEHAERVANMALAMLREAMMVISPATHKPLQIRVGMHSGPVVSGVVGTKMPRYCLFGDTVNTASRMESHGVPGQAHISGSAYEALKGSPFMFKSRGNIPVKGKGVMRTYFIIGKDGVLMDPDTNALDEFLGAEAARSQSEETLNENGKNKENGDGAGKEGRTDASEKDVVSDDIEFKTITPDGDDVSNGEVYKYDKADSVKINKRLGKKAGKTSEMCKIL